MLSRCTARRSEPAATGSPISRPCWPRPRRCAAATSSPGSRRRAARNASPRNSRSPICRSRRSSTSTVVPYETDEVTRLIVDTMTRGLRAGLASHRRRLSRLAAVGRGDDAVLAALAPGVTPEMAAAVARSAALQDLMVMAAKCSVVTRFRNTSGCPAGCRCGCSPTIRPTIRAASRPASSTACCSARRRRHRHQSGDRQSRARARAPVDARRDPRQARDPDAELRARACDDHARPDPQGLAGRPGVPVDRGHAGRQPQLRHRPRAARRGA